MRDILISETDVSPCEDAGSAPMLQWIRIADLVVDDRYQRDLKRENWTAIRKIAANFRWSRFSPVFVAPVEGGRFAIIDGQHRTHAAAMRGIEKVPCQVVQMSIEEQAEAFAAVNGMVTKVTLWNLYRASLTAGADWAVAVRNTAMDAGCWVAEANASTKSKKAGEIYAVDGFRRIVEKFGPAVVTSALKVMRRSKGWADEAVFWEGGVFLPALETLCIRPKLLEYPEIVGVFEAWPVWKCVDEIADGIKKAVRSGRPYRPRREQLQDSLAAHLTDRLPSFWASTEPKWLPAAEMRSLSTYPKPMTPPPCRSDTRKYRDARTEASA